MNENEEHFGKYKLIKQVGKGGMAELLLAKQSGIEGFEKLIVIKRILPHLVDSEEFIQMFLDEARLAAQLNHPNIVQIYDLGRFQDQYYIAMEYVNGVDLSLIMKRERKQDGKIPIGHAVKILSYICEALTYAHSRMDTRGKTLGLVHRDISPHNVLVSFDGGVKLTDFGIAKASSHAVKTKAGTLKGKYAYMSPEQCLGNEMDHRSDIFSVGILLYQMTTGTLPFTGSSEFSALHAIIHKAPRPPTVVREDFPVGLVAVLERTLAKDPSDRYPDALSLQVALENFLMEEKAVSNAALIGRYIRELFQDAVAAQSKEGSDGKTASVEGILSAMEIVKEFTQLTPSKPGLEPAPPADLPGSPGDADTDKGITPVPGSIHDKPTQLFEAPSREEGDGGTARIPSRRRSPSARRSRWLVPAVVGAVLLSAGFGALLVHLTRGNDQGDAERPATPSADASAGVGDGGAVLAGAASGPPDNEPGIDGGAVEVDAGRIGDGADSGRQVAASTTHKRKRRKRRDVKQTGEGFLNINSEPWTEVWVGKKKLGLTPLAYKKLPAGRHRVRMRNQPDGIDKTIWIRIRAGKTTVVYEDFKKQ